MHNPTQHHSGKCLLLLALLLVTSTPLLADTSAKEKGYEIAARSDRTDRGFSDSVVELNMILRNAAGGNSSRSLEIRTYEIQDEDIGDKSLVVFDSPRDIKGTALLSHAQILDPDNQWLYLPALKRVKRISSTNKSGPFVGSEFAFEDFTATELNKYSYQWLREEPCGEMVCDVVERFPRYENSGYTRQVSWIDQQVFQIRKLDFYDRKNALLKTLLFDDYRQYDNNIWRAHSYIITNHQSGKSTELIYSDFQFNTGLTENDFVKGILKRVN